jgi:hypothetical protein
MDWIQKLTQFLHEFENKECNSIHPLIQEIYVNYDLLQFFETFEVERSSKRFEEYIANNQEFYFEMDSFFV